MKNLIFKYKHLLLLLYMPFYMIWFGYIENSVTKNFHIIHTPLDDMIPFCEYFVIPYLLWFLYVAWGVLYFAFRDTKEYYRICAFLFTGMTLFLIISTIYPNGHYLRPYYFSHHNICTQLCEYLYTSDTPTNLFPSIHVYNSIGVHLAVVRSREFKHSKAVKTISFILMMLIILATMFIKQHSTFDVLTAIILAIVMNLIIYELQLIKKIPSLRKTS